MAFSIFRTDLSVYPAYSPSSQNIPKQDIGAPQRPCSCTGCAACTNPCHARVAVRLVEFLKNYSTPPPHILGYSAHPYRCRCRSLRLTTSVSRPEQIHQTTFHQHPLALDRYELGAGPTGQLETANAQLKQAYRSILLVQIAGRCMTTTKTSSPSPRTGSLRRQGSNRPDLCKRPVPPPADPAEQAERKLYSLPMHVTPVTPRTHQTRNT